MFSPILFIFPIKALPAEREAVMDVIHSMDISCVAETKSVPVSGPHAAAPCLLEKYIAPATCLSVVPFVADEDIEMPAIFQSLETQFRDELPDSPKASSLIKYSFCNLFNFLKPKKIARCLWLLTNVSKYIRFSSVISFMKYCKSCIEFCFFYVFFDSSRPSHCLARLYRLQ